MNIVHRFPPIDVAIWNHVGDLDANRKEKAQGVGRGHHNIKIPDEVILAMRQMHEIDRKTIRQVEESYPHVSINYVRRVLGYELRANLKVVR